MPLKKVNVVVEGTMLVPADEGDHPEHPIYIPIEPPPGIWGGANEPFPTPPIYIPVPPPSDAHPDHTLPGDLPHPDQGLPGAQPHPEHPIYVPVPPPDNDAHPEHPIYWPVFPEHPIVLPPGLSDEAKEALKAFVFGNLPPFRPPDYVAPV